MHTLEEKMKRFAIVLIVIMNLGSFLYSEEINSPSIEKVELQPQVSYASLYVNLGGTLVGRRALPGYMIGYKKSLQQGQAIDLSGSIAFGNYYDYSFLFPSIQFIQYAKPLQSYNPYVGIGLAFGDFHNEFLNYQELHFSGLFLSATLGTEFLRMEKFIGTAQIKVSEPLLPVETTETISYLAFPVIEATLGFGF